MKKYLAQLGEFSMGIEDHGLLTISLSADLEEGGTYGTICGISFGRSDWTSDLDSANYLGTYISGLLKAIGVDSTDQIRGKYVYLITNQDRLGLGSSSGDIDAIQGLKKAGSYKFDFNIWRERLRKVKVTTE